MATKPSRLLDWINDDSATKYTTPSAPQQLAGHQDATNADAKVFNWMWWRVSQWVEFLDNSFDSNGKDINAPKSTTITETISPTASCVTLDSGGIKSWDGSSNAIFSVTEAGVVTLGYSGNDIISLNAGVVSVCTASSADLVKLHAITASAANINQLTGNTFGGSTAGDVVTIDGTQTLTNKTLTTPKINEAVNLTATSSELNQLDGVDVGGNSSGDIVTTDNTQTLTNKTISFTQIVAGTAAAGRTFTITGHDTTPANFAFQGSSRYTQISCNAAGTAFSVLPSATSTVDFYIGNSSYRPTNLYLYAGTGGATLDTGSGGITLNTTGVVTVTGTTLDLNGSSLDIDLSGNAVITAGDDHSVAISGGLNTVGNNYSSLWLNSTDSGTTLLTLRNGSNTEVYHYEYNEFYVSSDKTTKLGKDGNRWAGVYCSNVNVTSISGDAIIVNDSAGDGISIVDWDSGDGGLHISIPTANDTRGQIIFNATSTALSTKYSGASGGEVAMFNNGGTIEFWFHNGTAWTKIA
jgi:hypothetical protein